MQLSFSDRDSQLGICWRSHVLDEDDYRYRFHEECADTMSRPRRCSSRQSGSRGGLGEL